MKEIDWSVYENEQRIKRVQESFRQSETVPVYPKHEIRLYGSTIIGAIPYAVNIVLMFFDIMWILAIPILGIISMAMIAKYYSKQKNYFTEDSEEHQFCSKKTERMDYGSNWHNSVCDKRTW